MNLFSILAVFTIGLSATILRASFDDLREPPLTLDDAVEKSLLRDGRDGLARRLMLASAIRSPNTAPCVASGTIPGSIYDANEGLLDHELAGEDPIEAWLSRYLAPAAE